MGRDLCFFILPAFSPKVALATAEDSVFGSGTFLAFLLSRGVHGLLVSWSPVSAIDRAFPPLFSCRSVSHPSRGKFSPGLFPFRPILTFFFFNFVLCRNLFPPVYGERARLSCNMFFVATKQLFESYLSFSFSYSMALDFILLSPVPEF